MLDGPVHARGNAGLLNLANYPPIAAFALQPGQTYHFELVRHRQWQPQRSASNVFGENRSSPVKQKGGQQMLTSFSFTHPIRA
jgi:hypothetical protein